jgi:hypothetical protein
MYPLLMAAMLGIGDGVFNTQLNALLVILFKHDTVLIKHINNMPLMFNKSWYSQCTQQRVRYSLSG